MVLFRECNGFVIEPRDKESDCVWIRVTDDDGRDYEAQIYLDKNDPISDSLEEFDIAGSAFLVTFDPLWFAFCDEKWTQEELDAADAEVKRIFPLLQPDEKNDD